MDRIIFLGILLCGFSSCHEAQRVFSEKDFLTTCRHSGYNFSLIMETSTSNFKNAQLVSQRNDSIVNTIDLGNDNFYLFSGKNIDTIKISKLVLVQMQNIEKYPLDTTVLRFGKFYFQIVSRPYFGATRLGLPEVNISSSNLEGDSLVIRSENNKEFKYGVNHIFFRDEAIYYYEYNNYILSSSFLGNYKKVLRDYRPFRNYE